ncbi:hypothetical protein [Hyalangium gracile]|uniref:hypothetical protein n=1 Tax=Hyalangium gracile TaxID=394092 RepID=UPI001CCDFE39|nr:hypothetical protein [Hyalangium gracile]
MPQHVLTWQRFVRDDDEKGEAVVELATRDNLIFERRGRRGDEPRESRKELASAAAAARGIEKRIATLLAKGFLEDGTAAHPEPAVDTRQAERDELEAAMHQRIARFNEALPAFVAAWQREGFDPLLDFIAEAARTRGANRKLPTELAERCLTLAADIFHVRFTRLEQGPEGEHARSRSIPIKPMRLAAFYVSPSRVAGIARAKALGLLGAHDGVPPEHKEGGWDFYGVDEEVARQIARLVGAPARAPGESS